MCWSSVHILYTLIAFSVMVRIGPSVLVVDGVDDVDSTGAAAAVGVENRRR